MAIYCHWTTVCALLWAWPLEMLRGRLQAEMTLCQLKGVDNTEWKKKLHVGVLKSLTEPRACFAWCFYSPPQPVSFIKQSSWDSHWQEGHKIELHIVLSIYPEETIIPKDICSSVFRAALFIIVRIWKQHKCPSIGEWIKMCYIYMTQ